MKEVFRLLKFCSRNGLILFTQAQTYINLQETRRMMQKSRGLQGHGLHSRPVDPAGRPLSHRALFPGLEISESLVSGFWSWLGLVTPCSSYFFPFGIGMFITVIISLVRPCIWEVDSLFSNFTGPQTGTNFAPGWIIPSILSIPDLVDLDDIWDFWDGDVYMRFWTLELML